MPIHLHGAILRRSACCRYSAPVRDYTAAYRAVKDSMSEAFFGPCKGGVYSPSVQYTLFEMARMAIDRCSALSGQPAW